MSGGIILDADNQFKLEVISKLELGKLTVYQCSQLLGKSERTIFRLLNKYRKQGALFLKHGNSLKVPWNKSDESIKTEVQRLIKEKYFDFNILHTQEKLKEEGIVIKRETLRKWAHEVNVVKRSKRRRGRARKLRRRMSQPGLMVQMDGSHHKWFACRETCLVAMIDDATNIVHAEFFEGETTVACMKALKDFVKKYGVFRVLYTDKAGVFGGIKRSNFSQVERALNELGAHVVYAHSPEAKGRIERLFGTLQDRLVAEMRLNKIRTLEQANEFLQTQYLPLHHNPRHSVLAENPESAYRSVPDGKDLDSVFCVKEYRVIKKDHTVSLFAERWMIANELKFSIAGHKLEIRFKADGSWQAWFADRKIKLIKVKKLKKVAGAPMY